MDNKKLGQYLTKALQKTIDKEKIYKCKCGAWHRVGYICKKAV